MDYYIVKITEKNIGLHQPIIAVGEKAELEKILLERFGTQAEIQFSPNKFPFYDPFIPKLSDGIYEFFDLIWEKE